MDPACSAGPSQRGQSRHTNTVPPHGSKAVSSSLRLSLPEFQCTTGTEEAVCEAALWRKRRSPLVLGVSNLIGSGQIRGMLLSGH